MSRNKKLLTMDEAEDMPIHNPFAEEATLDETPPDIENFLTETGLEGKEYRCTIKQFPPDERGIPVFMPGNWKGRYPSISEIGAKFGPGRYLYVFSWRVPDPSGNGTKPMCKQVEVSLGTEWQESHDEYMFQYSLSRKKRLAALRSRKEENDILNGNDSREQPRSGLDDLLEAKNKLSALGVPMGMVQQASPPATSDNGNIMGAVLQMQQKSTELMLAMMTNSQNQMMQLFGMMMQNNSNKNSGSMYQDAMKEAMSMVRETIDLKQALNPEKEGMVDKIFNFMQGVAPEITRILAQPRAQAKVDPMVTLAKSQPAMQEIMKDQAAIDLLASKLDGSYGVTQANEILDVMGVARSEQMKNNLKTSGINVSKTEIPDADYSEHEEEESEID